MVNSHGRFVWYRADDDDMEMRQGILRQCRGLGRAGRLDARFGL